MRIIGENLLSVYPDLIDAVKGGAIVSPRGQPVVECAYPLSWTLHCPEQWALAIPGRRINPFFALAEVVWMWAGKSGADFITYYNKNMSSFLDTGVPYFNAAYGARVRHAGYKETPFREIPYPQTAGSLVHVPVEVDQLEHVIRKLEGDPFTRQAVVSLWDPIKDNFIVSKDYPCNNMVYFSNRDGRLNVTVVIRSNDLIWGTPHNMVQFAHLQALIAGSLDLGVGWFTVLCNNLHYYTSLYTPTLSTVLDWSGKVREKGVNLEKFSRTLHQPNWDMRWKLDAFDLFVREVWMPLERDMRMHEEELISGPQDAYYQIQLMRLQDFSNRYDIPDYWQCLFTVMFMYHCRKGNAPMQFNSLLATLPQPMRWLITDFITKGVAGEAE
jgi:hypothetical protein